MFPPPEDLIGGVCFLAATVFLAECVPSKGGLDEAFVACAVCDCVVDGYLSAIVVGSVSGGCGFGGGVGGAVAFAFGHCWGGEDWEWLSRTLNFLARWEPWPWC